MQESTNPRISYFIDNILQVLTCDELSIELLSHPNCIDYTITFPLVDLIH
jgi:hypothetical protein